MLQHDLPLKDNRDVLTYSRLGWNRAAERLCRLHPICITCSAPGPSVVEFMLETFPAHNLGATSGRNVVAQIEASQALIKA